MPLIPILTSVNVDHQVACSSVRLFLSYSRVFRPFPAAGRCFAVICVHISTSFSSRSVARDEWEFLIDPPKVGDDRALERG
jgi:hypothetical protein